MSLLYCSWKDEALCDFFTLYFWHMGVSHRKRKHRFRISKNVESVNLSSKGHLNLVNVLSAIVPLDSILT